MKVFYTYRTDKPPSIDETVVFNSLYLLSEKTTYCCHVSSLISFLAKLKEWDNQLISMFYFRIITEEERKLTEEDIRIIIEDAKLARKIKNKNKLVLEIIAKESRIFKYMRDMLKWQIQETLIKIYMFQRLELITNENSLMIAPTQFADNTDRGELDMLAKLIEEVVLANEEIMMFNRFSPEMMNEFAIRIDNDSIEMNDGKNKFFCFPLFTMPNCYIENKTYKNMRVNFLKGMEPVSEKLYELKAMVAEETFGEKLLKKLKEFSATIQPHAEKMQKLFDNNIYVQKFINSRSMHVKFRLYIGVCSLDTLINLHEKANNMKGFSAAALLRSLEHQTDIDSCELFLYYDLVNHDNVLVD